MAKAYRSGKRDREAARDQKNQDKRDRLQRNRDKRATGRSSEIGDAPERMGEVALEDISPSGVASVKGLDRRMPMRLFVGGLSWDTTAEELRRLFEPLGEVSEATIVTDRDSGRSRGFGFVTMADTAAGKQAMRELDGAELDGRRIKVNPAGAR